jgi:hypothetical protein
MRTRIWLTALVAGVAAAGVPASGASAAASGVVYGGITPQKWPVMIQVARDGRSIERAAIGFTLNCNVGGTLANYDRYNKLVVSRAGKFSSKFGPTTTNNADGTKTVFSGSIAGKITGSKAKGTWQLVSIDQDAAGTATKTCDSGKVSWTATQ